MPNGNLARSPSSLVGLAHRELSRISGVSLRTIQRWSRGEVANPKSADKLMSALPKLEPRVKADFRNAQDLLRGKDGSAFRKQAGRLKSDYKYARPRLDRARSNWQTKIKKGDSGAGLPYTITVT